MPQTYRTEYYSDSNALRNTVFYKSIVHREDRFMAARWVATGFYFDTWLKDVKILTPIDVRYKGCNTCRTALHNYDYVFNVDWGHEHIPE